MDGVDLVDRLDFKQQALFHHQVQSELAIDVLPFVFDREGQSCEGSIPSPCSLCLCGKSGLSLHSHRRDVGVRERLPLKQYHRDTEDTEFFR